MQKRTLDIRLNRPQFEAFNAVGPRTTVFCGYGRGIGKSFLMRRIWYTQIARWEHQTRWSGNEPIRGVRIIPIMPTLTQFKDVHGSDLLEELGPGGAWSWLGAKIDKSRFHITFPGGSWIKPFPASAYNSRTSRGMRGDIIGADEIDDIDAEVYNSVAIPWLSASWSLGIELPFGTPTRGRHGLWYRFLEAGRLGARVRSGEVSAEEALTLPVAQALVEMLSGLDAESYPESLPKEPREAALSVLRGYYGLRATYKDAPETVSPLAVARARATTPEATFKREWEADPDAGEGLVYPFDETFHVRQPPPLNTFREFIVGGDHGWVDPGVLILAGVQGHGNDATLWLLDERYESECPNHVWDKRAKDWAFARSFFLDPSRPDRIRDYRNNAGVNAIGADNDIDGGISQVANLMFRRKSEHGPDWSRLYVSPACRNTIREFGLYRRKKRPDGTFDEAPADKDNHAMDAIRYLTVGRFGRGDAIRHVAPGR